jgi:glutaryl-CoA dehydrogenase
MVVRLSHLQDEGKLKTEHASLTKACCTVKMRETASIAQPCAILPFFRPPQPQH